MNKQEYVTALRELADFIESKELPDEWIRWNWGTKSNYPIPSHDFAVNSKEQFGQIAAALGSFEKVSTDSDIRAVVILPSGASVTARVDHEIVCERVVVGKKTVPFQQAYLVEAVEEHEEDIVEWKCPDSFIALGKEKANANQ